MPTACPTCEQQGIVPTPPAYPGCPPAPPATGCSAVWGGITGTIGNQTDLVPYLQTLFALLAVTNVFAQDQTINGLTIGRGAGDGTENTALGASALSSNTTAVSNTAVGFEALKDNDGSLNTAVGASAGVAVTSGQDNTLVGAFAGANITTGFNNVAVGNWSGPATSGLSGTVAIGYGVGVSKNNQVVIGGSGNVETVLRGDIVVDKTITSIGTTGAQTINKTSGSVVFAGGAVSLLVTNSKAIAPTSGATGSIIICQIRTADATAVLGSVVCAADGSFTINMKVAPTGATRVDFILTN